MTQGIAFGIYSISGQKKRLAARIGEEVIDLYVMAGLGYFDDLKIKKSVFRNDFLNDFISVLYQNRLTI
jgi:Fumarylacetoacetase N-terminal